MLEFVKCLLGLLRGGRDGIGCILDRFGRLDSFAHLLRGDLRLLACGRCGGFGIFGGRLGVLRGSCGRIGGGGGICGSIRGIRGQCIDDGLHCIDGALCLFRGLCGICGGCRGGLRPGGRLRG